MLVIPERRCPQRVLVQIGTREIETALMQTKPEELQRCSEALKQVHMSIMLSTIISQKADDQKKEGVHSLWMMSKGLWNHRRLQWYHYCQQLLWQHIAKWWGTPRVFMWWWRQGLPTWREGYQQKRQNYIEWRKFKGPHVLEEWNSSWGQDTS